VSYRLLHGDALDVLETLEPQSVHCVVTSPPYWGLRDYGTDGQIGLEATPEEYVRAMVSVFDRVWRVLRDDGTLWLNLGDSYAGGGRNSGNSLENTSAKQLTQIHSMQNGPAPVPEGLKPKDLVGIPWRVAFALQAAGWYLRSDIIWAKKNCMPESVTDRPTKSHEYLFLLTKRPHYYYDADAVREKTSYPAGQIRKPWTEHKGRNKKDDLASWASNYGSIAPENGRNRRSVWTIATEPYPEAHFATYPTALVKPCILAGTSERGVCPACGKPWERVTERGELREHPARENRNVRNKADFNGTDYARRDNTLGLVRDMTTTGWRAGCACDAGEPVPATVLDPFCGSGTTGLVALTYGRDFIGIDLSPEYLAMAERRIAPAAAQEVMAL